jgi:WD40 repeat protein
MRSAWILILIFAVLSGAPARAAIAPERIRLTYRALVSDIAKTPSGLELLKQMHRLRAIYGTGEASESSLREKQRALERLRQGLGAQADDAELVVGLREDLARLAESEAIDPQSATRQSQRARQISYPSQFEIGLPHIPLPRQYPSESAMSYWTLSENQRYAAGLVRWTKQDYAKEKVFGYALLDRRNNRLEPIASSAIVSKLSPAVTPMISPDDRTLVLPGPNNAILEHDFRTGAQTVHPGGGPILDFRFSPDSRYIVAVRQGQSPSLVDRKTGEELSLAPEMSEAMPAFSPDSRWFGALYRAASSRLWIMTRDLRAGTNSIWKFRGGAKRDIVAFAMTNREVRWVEKKGDDIFLERRDLRSEAVIETRKLEFSSTGQWPRSSTERGWHFSADGRTLLALRNDGRALGVHFYDIDTQRKSFGHLDLRVHRLAVAPGGKSGQGLLRILHSETQYPTSGPYDELTVQIADLAQVRPW